MSLSVLKTLTWYLFIRPMTAVWNRVGHYIFALWFLLSICLPVFFLFSSPNLSRRRLDVCHTCTHGVALCIQADQNLFNKVLHNPDHVLHRLLPPVAHTSHNYCLRPRARDRSLPERLTHLTDCNFIIRMLFYQGYWLYLMPACFIVLQLRSDSC